MRINRQVSSIVALVAVQVLLFVFYSFRFHHGVRQRAEDTWQPLLQPGRQWLTDNTSDRGVSGHDGKTAKDVGYTIATGVDSSTGNDKRNYSDTKSVSTSPSSVVSTTASVSILVRNSTRQSGAGRLAHETTSTIDFGTGHDAADSNVVGGGGAGIVRSRGSNRRLYPSDKKLTFPKKLELSDDCELHFLQRYSTYCEQAIVPPLEVENSTLCPCVPSTLAGETHISFSNHPLAETESEHRELLPGGRWQPTDCVARQRVAIIIPFRDRESHLEIFLRTIHPFLQRQLLQYTVFVVEQHSPKIFNKASLMNAGFKEIVARHQFDCFVFHDVDLLPETDRNLYGCYKSPRHIGAFVDKFHYKLLYNTIFGGATAFTETQFTKVNGYSNEFYGWGGEDDDMYNRIKWHHQDFIRFPRCIARYRMIKHKRDKSNPYDQKRANKAWSLRPKVYKNNGLNSVAYKVESYEERILFTWILISLPEVPPSTDPLIKRSKTKSS